MSLPADGPLRILTRWTVSLAAIVAIHVAAYTALQTVTPAPTVPSDDPIMLDLAPAPVAPPLAPVIAPPEPVAPPEPPPPQPPPPEVKPEVVLPEPPPPSPKPKPVRKLEKPVKHDTPPPPPAPTTESAPTPAPAPAAPVVTPQQITWQSRLGTYLARFKRYPISAQRRNEQGIVLMHLVIQRDGKVLSAKVVRGSGFADLDEAAAEWVTRASPVPAFPDDMAQERLDVTVPFRFSLR